jgi:hypothetical protein
MAWDLHGIQLESIWMSITIQMEYIDCEAGVKPFLTLQKCIKACLWPLGWPSNRSDAGPGTAYRGDATAWLRGRAEKRKPTAGLAWDWNRIGTGGA